jgi:hypothetical protein
MPVATSHALFATSCRRLLLPHQGIEVLAQLGGTGADCRPLQCTIADPAAPVVAGDRAMLDLVKYEAIGIYRRNVQQPATISALTGSKPNTTQITAVSSSTY